VSITSLWSGLAAGIVIGLLGRLLVGGRQRTQVGCLLTILIGIVGAAIGTAIGNAADVGDLVTFVIQVVAAALLVAMFGAASRR
jgi:uncharacterized membrane protein YeaQ/YmgE (transglycosylase-associated protein family)